MRTEELERARLSLPKSARRALGLNNQFRVLYAHLPLRNELSLCCSSCSVALFALYLSEDGARISNTAKRDLLFNSRPLHLAKAEWHVLRERISSVYVRLQLNFDLSHDLSQNYAASVDARRSQRQACNAKCRSDGYSGLRGKSFSRKIAGDRREVVSQTASNIFFFFSNSNERTCLVVGSRLVGSMFHA